MSAETSPYNEIPSASTTSATEKKPATKRVETAASSPNPNARKAKGPEVTQDATPAWPIDVTKFFDESRERLRAAFDQASDRFEHVRSTARDTSDVLQDCHSSVISNLKDINEQTLEGLHQEVDRIFDYGRQVTEVKSLSELLEAHGNFVRDSFAAGINRARALNEMSVSLFKASFEPLQSGMANVISQAKKRGE